MRLQDLIAIAGLLVALVFGAHVNNNGCRGFPYDNVYYTCEGEGDVHHKVTPGLTIKCENGQPGVFYTTAEDWISLIRPSPDNVNAPGEFVRSDKNGGRRPFKAGEGLWLVKVVHN